MEQQPEPPKLGKPSWALVLLGIVVLGITALGVYWARNRGTVVVETTAGATTTTTTKAVASDTLLTAGLVTGAALMITGILWSRIKSVALPGGATVTLDSDEVGKGKDAVALAARELNSTQPEVVATATSRVLPALARYKTQSGDLTDDEFMAAAREAVLSAQKMFAE